MRDLCHEMPLQSDVIHSHVYHTEPMIYRIQLLDGIEKYVNPSHVDTNLTRDLCQEVPL